MKRDVADIAQQMGRELGPLRRAISRATRAADGLPDLPDNQIEVLRAVRAERGVSTSAIAKRLQLARPTVSNLLASMRRAGLIEMARPYDDGRRVEVIATEHALELLERFDRTSERIVTDALMQLNPQQLASLASAMPALMRMNEILRQA